MRLILASASPRRRELIARVTDDFTVVTSGAAECSQGDAAYIAAYNSRAKAVDVSATHEGLVLGADTVVSIDGKTLGKPKDRAHAVRMLGTLRGRTHEVITGVTLTDGKKTVTATESTRVTFDWIPDNVIARYVSDGGSDGKAGGYGIQDEALKKYISYQGDYDNVVGLPVALVRNMITDFYKGGKS